MCKSAALPTVSAGATGALVIIPVPQVLKPAQVRQLRAHLDQADWIDGSLTAGAQARTVKHNQQLAPDSRLAQQLGELILTALAGHAVFISAALPLKIFPPQFNRYQAGETYGLHVDNAIRIVPGSSTRVRTDLSATLFLSEPQEYEGGELLIEDNFGSHSVKLSAGDLILYPATSLHKVTPVTAGARVSSFFWLQSMVRDNERRAMLFDLDQSVQSLTALHGHEQKDVVRLSWLYHNLIRQWADT